MTYRQLACDPRRDFTRVRDFLASTILRLGTLFTWDVSRWNYARHFVAPYRGGDEGIGAWERRIGLWEAPNGDVAGVVNGELPGPGTAYLQLDPRHESILDAMISYAEERFVPSTIPSMSRSARILPTAAGDSAGRSSRRASTGSAPSGQPRHGSDRGSHSTKRSVSRRNTGSSAGKKTSRLYGPPVS